MNISAPTMSAFADELAAEPQARATPRRAPSVFADEVAAEPYARATPKRMLPAFPIGAARAQALPPSHARTDVDPRAAPVRDAGPTRADIALGGAAQSPPVRFMAPATRMPQRPAGAHPAPFAKSLKHATTGWKAAAFAAGAAARKEAHDARLEAALLENEGLRIERMKEAETTRRLASERDAAAARIAELEKLLATKPVALEQGATGAAPLPPAPLAPMKDTAAAAPIPTSTTKTSAAPAPAQTPAKKPVEAPVPSAKKTAAAPAPAQSPAKKPASAPKKTKTQRQIDALLPWWIKDDERARGYKRLVSPEVITTRGLGASRRLSLSKRVAAVTTKVARPVVATKAAKRGRPTPVAPKAAKRGRPASATLKAAQRSRAKRGRPASATPKAAQRSGAKRGRPASATSKAAQRSRDVRIAPKAAKRKRPAAVATKAVARRLK